MSYQRHLRPRQAGQTLVIGVLVMLTIIAMCALVLEGGNAYAHQRAVQNGADAAADAGALVLARGLAGEDVDTAAVGTQVSSIAAANALPAATAWYTDWQGHLLDTSGAIATSTERAARVGIDAIPSGAQGVAVSATTSFGTSFGNLIGINSLTASANATAVTGPLIGGPLLPIVFPINIVDCETNGDLGVGSENWWVSGPGSAPGDTPNGPEYIVPLCKTGDGNFMILNLDPALTCAEEISTPPLVQWDAFPVDVPSDNGNDCAKRLLDGVNALAGQVVLIPICDADCVTSHGSNATYHIVKVASFYLDPVLPISDRNGGTNPACQAGVSASGHNVTPIAGNGSDSCLIGWFVRYIETGPVGNGPVGNVDAIGVQLIR